jgi:demethylmenaquinone methyltransferase / 2-methoxy-6-polyprenyl-1,4-benzoquinol methylase
MPKVNQNPHHVLTGTRPPGAADERAAARFVRQLFSDVAGRYDLLNHLLSLNVDRYWRWAVARRFRHVLQNPEARVLDLCCGTGDLGLALVRRAGARSTGVRQGSARIIGSDFAHAMLRRARQKVERTKRPQRSSIFTLAEADALQLPFRDHSFDLVACAFGFRNLANYRAGLEEIHRVLRPGGEAGILEFSEPTGALAPLYSFYFHRILPALGEWITGVGGAYRYLTTSVDRFPGREEFMEMMQAAGFTAVRARKLTGGIAVLYAGRKPSL